MGKAWGVSPRAIRHLIGKSLETVGQRWAGKFPELLRLLDALPLEILPGDTREEWDRFSATVARVQRFTPRQLWTSVAALAVLREELVARKGRARDEGDADARRARLAAGVDDLRRSLELAIEVELEARGVTVGGGVLQSVEALVGGTMAKLLRKGSLADAAWRYEQAKASELDGADEDEERSLLSGRKFWPLFPEPVNSRDGSLRVVSLSRTDQFLEYALALSNCLWASSFYREIIRSGNGAVLVFLDAGSGQARSAAQVHLGRDKVRRRWSFKVMEHRGPRNKPPSEECVKALGEALRHCEQPEIQWHLDRGAGLRDSLVRDGNRGAWRRWEAEQMAPSLKAAVGADRYEALVGSACALLVERAS